MSHSYFQPTNEIIYYQDESGLIVSSSRIIFGPKILFLTTLSSIRIVEIPAKKVYPSIIMTIGIIIFFAAFPQLNVNLLNSLAGIGIAAACLIGSTIWFLVEKPYYSLKLGGFMGEMDLIISKDKDYLDLIIFSINQALQKIVR